ncbi:hypothetical protein ACJ72_08177 [Emergomyces africanus]|uniref:Uncharacterized protein n=1 Tax=Emergomyces africanus TaxID=1955775 RepID=A0A1B7NL30_9EURO|nr:hypothetical protein ACJ72_08177 [Emergomyces africanus]
MTKKTELLTPQSLSHTHNSQRIITESVELQAPKIQSLYLIPELYNQVMSHSRSSIFMTYLNELVNCDTQSVFLGTSTRDALIALSTNSSLTRDPSAPQHLTREQLQQVENNQELVALEDARVAFQEDLIAEYSKISNVKDQIRYDTYQKLCRQVQATRKRLQKQLDKKSYKQFFENVGNTIIENNYHGRTTTFKPNSFSVLSERKALTALEFKNRDVSAIPDEQLMEDRIQSLKLRLALDRLSVPRHMTRCPKPEALTQSACIDFPIRTSTGMECPECLGDMG